MCENFCQKQFLVRKQNSGRYCPALHATKHNNDKNVWKPTPTQPFILCALLLLNAPRDVFQANKYEIQQTTMIEKETTLSHETSVWSVQIYAPIRYQPNKCKSRPSQPLLPNARLPTVQQTRCITRINAIADIAVDICGMRYWRWSVHRIRLSKTRWRRYGTATKPIC